jgi:hypothetical protein
MPFSYRCDHATSGDIEKLEVTLLSSAASCFRRERAYTASVAHIL